MCHHCGVRGRAFKPSCTTRSVYTPAAVRDPSLVCWINFNQDLRHRAVYLQGRLPPVLGTRNNSWSLSRLSNIVAGPNNISLSYCPLAYSCIISYSHCHIHDHIKFIDHICESVLKKMLSVATAKFWKCFIFCYWYTLMSPCTGHVK